VNRRRFLGIGCLCLLGWPSQRLEQAADGEESLVITVENGSPVEYAFERTVHAVELVAEQARHLAGTPTRAGLDQDANRVEVVRVTTTRDGGEGSLRDACERPGSYPLVIVFDVGGTIHLERELGIARSRTYVAGQTAPGHGVLIKGFPVRVRASDVIVRGLMIRPGEAATPEASMAQDGIGIGAAEDIADIWIDQCDVSHSVDELCGIRANHGCTIRRVAVTNCLMIEPLRDPAIRHEDNHNFGILIGRGTYDYLIADTIIAGCRARTPIVETGTRGCIFGVFTHDYQSGGSSTRGQRIPIQPLVKSGEEVGYLDDLSIRYSVSGFYAEPGEMSRAQGASLSPWPSWPEVDNAGEPCVVFEADNWFPANWQAVFRATGPYGGELPSSGAALPTPRLAEDVAEEPEVWSRHAPTHGTATRRWTLARAGARPKARDACAERLVAKLETQLEYGPAGWAAGMFEPLYAAVAPSDPPPDEARRAWELPARPFETEPNGLTAVENALEARMVDMGGVWPRNVGRPIRPSGGGMLTVTRDGLLKFDPLGEFDASAARSGFELRVSFTDGRRWTVRLATRTET
jgi:hypothetical protein